MSAAQQECSMRNMLARAIAIGSPALERRPEFGLQQLRCLIYVQNLNDALAGQCTFRCVVLKGASGHFDNGQCS